MTRAKLWEKVNNEYLDSIIYAYERWECEKEYEDINDYLKFIREKIPEAIEMTKKPFGFICKCEDGFIHLMITRQGDYIELSAVNK